jgi:hypothetical protein
MKPLPLLLWPLLLCASAFPQSQGVSQNLSVSLSYTITTNHTAILSWTAVSCLNSSGAPVACNCPLSYNVYRGTISGGETSYHRGVTGLTWTDTAIPFNTTLYYEVTAYEAACGNYAADESAMSNEIAIVVPAAPTGTPAKKKKKFLWFHL